VKKILNLSDLGLVEYGEALQLQKTEAERRASGGEDILFLLEHPHVITLGKKTSPENFRSQPIPVFQVDRGGDATYHGPGQLVGYLIMLLEDHDVRRFVRNIEQAIIESLAAFGIQAGRKDEHRGVWVGHQKIASIGVAVSNWVSYHGFALNVNTDLSYFSLIKPCGWSAGANFDGKGTG